MNPTKIFDLERIGPTVIVTPRRDPDELTFDERAEGEIGELFDQLGIGKAKNVVVDCHRIDRCCSSAISFFVQILKSVQGIGGRMAFCNVSTHLRKVFEVLNLHGLWMISGSRDVAIADVEGAMATD